MVRHLSPGRLIISALVVTSAVAGCGRTGGDASSAPGIPALALRQDLRIDGYEEDLVPIQWMGVASDGRIALLQWQDHAVRFYDPSGDFLGAVGQEGDGPTDFRRLVRAGWIGDTDTLWVSDTQLRRAVIISPEMEIVRTVRNHELARPMSGDSGRVATYRQPTPYAVFGDGSSLVWAISPVEGSGPELDGSPVLRLSPDGRIWNVVGVIPRGEDSGVTVSLSGGGVLYRQVPFAAERAWTVSPRGSRLAVLTPDMTLPEPTFDVLVVDAAGDTVIDRSYPFDPIPIPPARLDSAIAARGATVDASLRMEVESKLREAAPDFYSEAEDIVIGSDQRVWVGMRSRPEGTRWLVLSATGDPEAEVVLPPRVELAAADQRHLWCVEEDELGVESVVRYAIEAESPAGDS